MRKYTTTVLLLMIVLTTGSRAFAEKNKPVYICVSPGINLGSSAGTGYHVGANLSIERLFTTSLYLVGGYGDFLWSDNEFRSSIGPRIGIRRLSIDVGFLGVFPRTGDTGIKPGITTRLVANCGYAGVYGRYNYIPVNNEGYIEFGVLLGVPMVF
ncbi:MAG: hypothetical protein GY754_04985 [bacterium]|nr:hypothetical protein [bacterium]